jgi:hypothetical protein
MAGTAALDGISPPSGGGVVTCATEADVSDIGCSLVEFGSVVRAHLLHRGQGRFVTVVAPAVV